MNSRKKRFWKLWQKRNEETAVTNVEEANRIRHIKFLGEPLPEYIQCFENDQERINKMLELVMDNVQGNAEIDIRSFSFLLSLVPRKKGLKKLNK